MKLAISNIAWAEEQDEAVYALMQKHGYTGLEIAPTRIFPERPYISLKEAAIWRTELQEQHGFAVPSMQSIWFGRKENIFGGTTERKALLQYTKQAITFAETINCRNLVFGCPRNRLLPKGASPATAVRFFREIAEYALAHGTVIGLEANPTIYQTNFINTTQDAFRILSEVASDGLRVNLDTGTMLFNQEAVDSIVGKVRHISHVHISEPMLAPLQQQELHLKLAECLCSEGYNGYVSIEMGRQTDLALIEAALQYVHKIFG